jgi:hypothetical protein
MKKTLLFAIMALLCITLPVFSEDYKSTSEKLEKKRKEVWEEFHKVRFEKFGKFQKIDLYAENDSLTEICFICDKGLFIYYYRDSNNNGISHIEPVVHAKVVKYDTINRITYEKWNSNGFFKLWYYETEELSIGAGN